MTQTFMRLTRTTPGEWKRPELQQLRQCELEGLAKLLGVPYYGTKPQQVERLLSLGSLRELLADYDGPDVRAAAQLRADGFFKRELKGMASMAKIWKSGSKIQLAIGLLQWRNECRRRGQMFYAEWQAVQRAKPKQLSLPYQKAA